jgi:RNA polymerase sigma-70 factor (ECF subfamily)
VKFDTSDLVQEAFLHAHRRFDTFHGSTHGELLAWLRRILLNNMLNLSRGYANTLKRSIGREQPLTADGAVEETVAGRGCPSEEVQAREEYDLVSACLSELPEHYRQVILLRFQEELSFAEIGRVMNRSEDAAQKLWDRALVMLRKRLGF